MDKFPRIRGETEWLQDIYDETKKLNAKLDDVLFFLEQINQNIEKLCKK